jgi:small subunit ribosomal protein S6
MLYLVAATYTEDELAPIKEKVKNLIKKFEGEITGEDSFGKKKLAYPVKKFSQGYYLLYEFDLDGNNLLDLNKGLKLTNEVLRHIIVNKPIKAKVEVKSADLSPKKPKTDLAKEKIEKEKRDENKIKLEDLDQRLDEILGGDII